MKKTFTLVLLIVYCVPTIFAQQPLRVNIDLTKVQNDRVPVTIELPEIEKNYVEYHMAKIVPGTYSISDFGRFVTDFSAYDKQGNELTVSPMGSTNNIYGISNADKLQKITYWVDDTFDKTPRYQDNIVFEPSGTNIAPEENVFVMNTFGFIGYIDGMKSHPYELTIKHDESIYGATSLKRSSITSDTDVFIAENFNFLADAPIMYSPPDTVTRHIAGAEILVSVFSPNDKMKASDVMDNIYDLMVAQSEYLGGKLPVDRYAYLIYLMDYNSLSGAMGALEHSYSSLYTLPESDPQQLAQTVRDVAAHEFFHIVTPLNIHSEEIHDFNYIEPKMSQHLWLYEGVTEYSSMHVQVKYNLFDRQQFLRQVQEKLQLAEQFPSNVSFTEMSKNILDPDYESMYTNVYYKGALIAMCLDLYIMKYSNQDKNLQWLIQELSREYGKHKAFKDEELFDKIESLTSEQVGNFLRKYIAGKASLPIQEVLDWVGVNYEEENVKKQISLGKISLNLNEKQEIYIQSTAEMNEFGEAMGYEEGDVLVSLNGVNLSLVNINSEFEKYTNETEEGDLVTIVVKRQEADEEEEFTLQANAIAVEVKDRHILSFNENPSEEQEKIREKWLNKY